MKKSKIKFIKERLTSSCKPAVVFWKKLSPYIGDGRLIALIASCFCLSTSIEILFQKGNFANLSFIDSMNLTRFFSVMALTFICILFAMAISHVKELIPYSLLFTTMMLALTVVRYKNDFYFAIGVCLVVIIVAVYLINGDKLSLSKIKLKYKHSFIITAVLFVLFSAFMSYGTIMRYYAYQSSNFDFGIFTQMFEYMKNTGLPITTLERNVTLSHFNIHFSPVYYLLLPGYMIFSCPQYLLIMQAIAVGSGVFALYFICKELGFSPKVTVAFSFVYLFYPALSNAQFYDFHENAFLSAFILWTCYFMLKSKMLLTFTFALLTLSVKEDAAIYIFAIALFMILNRKKYLNGIALFVLAALYFAGALTILTLYGNGVMTNRLDNYWVAGSDGSLFNVVKTVFCNFGYLLIQVFQDKKFIFIGYMLAPVLFLPFFSKKTSTLSLLIPMLVINLMPQYVYEYDIGYQYIFGSAVLVIFAAVIAAKRFSPKMLRSIMLCSMCVSIVLFVSVTYPRTIAYSSSYFSNREVIAQTDEILFSMPENESITTQTYFAPQLYKCDLVYMYPYDDSGKKTMYMIRDSRNSTSTEESIAFMKIVEADYTLVKSGGYCEVYKLTTQSEAKYRFQGLLVE